MPAPMPTADEVLARMRAMLGEVPAAIEKSLAADPTLLFDHARSRQFAMPDDGALDDQTRTLVYLAVALATSNHECTRAMLAKARTEQIAAAKLLEAFHIARLARATEVLSSAEPLFDLINERATQNGKEQQ